MPFVTVIIPNYNHADFLPARISSVLNQSFTNLECIILDDASTDNSVAIIKEFAAKDSRISFYLSDKNSGSPFIQWNKGVKLAKGELIWIAESDDVAHLSFLKTMIEHIGTNPSVALAYCQSNKMDDNNMVSGTWKQWTDDLDEHIFKGDFLMNGSQYIERFLIYRNTIPNASAVVFRKSVYNEIGGANEKVFNCSDWLTWLKMLLNHPLSFSAEPLNFFRYHKNSVIARANVVKSEVYKAEFDFEMRKIFDKFLGIQKKSISVDIKKINDRFIYHAIGNYGLYNFKNGNKLKGLLQILMASWYPGINFNFIKRLLFLKPAKL